MNDDQIRDTILALKRRGGLSRLLRLLGFPTDGRRRRPPRSLAIPVRAMRTATRGTLRAHIVVLRGDFTATALRDLNGIVHEDDPLSHHILIIAEPNRRRVVIGCSAPGASLRHIVLEPDAIRHSDIDILREIVAIPDEAGTSAILRIHRALDRRQLTTRFFRDIRAVRDAIASGWTGVPDDAAADRDALALLLLSRLMFLYFLQRRGLLNGDLQYLPRLLMRWRRHGGRGTFYRLVLRTMFFGVLNRRIERRTARARSLGEMPYLNGGLFEQHQLECSFPRLDLPDSVVIVLFDALLEKYRFTTADTSASDSDDIGAGLDPEMLGRIFEGLMPGEKRSRTGTFYTPAGTVARLVVDTLATHLAATTGARTDIARDALLGRVSDATDIELASLANAAAQLRVLDPACGSGAFLLDTLARLVNVREHASASTRLEIARDIIAQSLHGVDLLGDAALICSLRLWLTLVPQCDRIEDVPPLPNLDRRVRQGDALIDPIDVGNLYTGRPLGTLAPPELRPLMMRLGPAAQEYIASGPETRPALRRALASLETRLARAWLTAIERDLDYELRELNARSRDVDLFGAPTSTAESARARLPVMLTRRTELTTFLDDTRGRHTLPFFSFRVHFAEVDGFDIVLSNPPWVRAHNWPPTVRQLLRDRYRVCADAGWPRANGNGGTIGAGAQVDLAFLFLERAIRLLRNGGTLGLVLPAKLIRSLAPGGARALLLGDTQLASIEDHSLDHRAVFDADAFTAVIVARRRTVATTGRQHVHVRMTRGNTPALEFDVPIDELPLEAGDMRAPWLLAPPACAAAFRAMQHVGTRIADAGLSVRRGAMTGANDVMVVHDVEPKLGDLAHIRAEGWHSQRREDRHRREYAAHVEASVLRPVLRGTDVQPWRTRVERHVLYSPLNDDQRAHAPPRLSRYLSRHSERLRQPADRIGTLQRLSTGMFGHKVVWSDLASDLRAAAVPAFARAITGLSLPVIPLNTAYFIPTRDADTALLLAAYLNSKPLRTFARAIAERAKDAHFRFFAWTIAMLPLPHCWRDGSLAIRLIAISREAHDAGGIPPQDRTELDAIVAHAFGLTAEDVNAIDELDAWFNGGVARVHTD